MRSVPRLLGVPTLNGSGCTRIGRVGSVAKRRRVLTDSGPCPPLGPWNLYSRDGVMRGVLSPSSDKLRVGIVAQAGWSRWHAVADSLGWHTVWVAVRDCPIGQAWCHVLGSLSVHHVSVADFPAGLVDASTLDVVLLDGRLPNKFFSGLWVSPTLRLVVGSSFPQRGGTALGWESHSSSWTHSDCGGVSSACGILTYAGCTRAPLLPYLLGLIGNSRAFLAPPKVVEVLGPRLRHLWLPQVTSTSRAWFHGDGLFPAEIPDLWLDLPDCLSSTGWAYRKMTFEELLTTADIPVDLQDSPFYSSGILPLSMMLLSPYWDVASTRWSPNCLLRCPKGLRHCNWWIVVFSSVVRLQV